MSDKLRFESFYIMREIWEKHDPYYLINEAKQFIDLKNSQIKEPFKYLGHVCDDHYSKFGSEFISMETVKIIKNLELN